MKRLRSEKRWLGYFVAASALLAVQAMAHGPQIQLTGETGKLITREVVEDGPYSDALSDPKLLYVMPVLDYNGVWYSRPNLSPDPIDPNLPEFYSGPGYAFGYDRTQGGTQLFAAGSNFGLNFTTGLQRWDGSSFVDAGAVELESFRGSLVSRTVDNGASPSLELVTGGITTYDAEAHSTVRYRFLGDGTSTAVAPSDGVYLATLQLTSTSPGMQASDPFQFVLYKGTGIAEVTTAVNSLGVDSSLTQFVPEPVWGTSILGCFLLAAIRRNAIRMGT